MSRRPDSATNAPAASSTSGPIQVTDDSPYCASEPLPHANRPLVSVRNSRSSVTVTESSAIAIAEPASTSRVGPDPAPEARVSTRAAAARPPTKARPPANGTGSVQRSATASTSSR
jgi:hypothetical protein